MKKAKAAAFVFNWCMGLLQSYTENVLSSWSHYMLHFNMHVNMLAGNQ